MINANDRPHFHQKAKVTKFLRQLAAYEGNNVLRDYFGLPYSEDKPCKVKVRIYPPKSDSKAGAVLPLNINGRDFTITVEKEITE